MGRVNETSHESWVMRLWALDYTSSAGWWWNYPECISSDCGDQPGRLLDKQSLSVHRSWWNPERRRNSADTTDDLTTKSICSVYRRWSAGPEIYPLINAVYKESLSVYASHFGVAKAATSTTNRLEAPKQTNKHVTSGARYSGVPQKVFMVAASVIPSLQRPKSVILMWPSLSSIRFSNWKGNKIHNNFHDATFTTDKLLKIREEAVFLHFWGRVR